MPICDCSAYINVKSHLNTYYITNYKLSFFFLKYILILLNNYDKLNIKNYKKLKTPHIFILILLLMILNTINYFNFNKTKIYIIVLIIFIFLY